MIRFRASKEDVAMLKEHARALNMNQSEFLRFLINLPVQTTEQLSTEDDQPIKVLVLDRSQYHALVRNVRAIGTLYNQATRALNTIANKRFLSDGHAREMLAPALNSLRKINEHMEENLKLVEVLRSGQTIYSQEVSDHDDARH